MNGTLTDVPGIRVGHADDPSALTGCTVILSEEGAVGGVDQRGGAPGTRETDLLRPLHLVQQVHGVVLAGGSAFGLAAADGVMRYLAERGVGYDAGPARVPIVPAAILFDLGVGRPDVWPDAAMGYHACEVATGGPVVEGGVGVGMGCTVGQAMGPALAARGGVGSASIDLGDGLVVAALVAVNAFGDVVDEAGKVIAGPRLSDGSGFANTLALLGMPAARAALQASGATVIGVVATNARLTKEQANKVAQMAHDGLARAIRPAHTMLDGDTLFALATGRIASGEAGGSAGRTSIPDASATAVGAYAAEVVAQSIRRAVRASWIEPVAS